MNKKNAGALIAIVGFIVAATSHTWSAADAPVLGFFLVGIGCAMIWFNGDSK